MSEGINHLVIMDNAIIHNTKIEDYHNYLLYSVTYHPYTLGNLQRCNKLLET